MESGGSVLIATPNIDAKTERLTLKLPSPIQLGPATINIAYVGTLNDKVPFRTGQADLSPLGLG